ncbi:H2O-forming NADH oxidase [Streptococcus iniae]|uniref:NADH oxidase n=1 Tax=Streptococcus iniae TaxID=1346 RepID=A0A3L8GKR3_STRIN|nr:FAD-dependent oxidoreductase [Streptococcus iniae]AGM98842.1 NADH oxidase [Streptococcus iniae SF1]AHY15801.1 NADH oxidase [Streptococcus iniae]AHY17669.1 NADH oxidase [Streptococcus iniae]AJG25966.1 NADH oxidase [Streptococcus iniae]APD31841.1 NADH oxidase [Streptococcus iniae]
MSKIVVVGTNHAGTAAIKTMLNQYGKENEIVCFDQNSNISFLGCGMALWIGEQIDSAEGLFYSDKEELESLGATVHMESPVVHIDYDKKEVTALVNGKEHIESYDKLLLATGSQPIIPPIKGVEIKEGSREFEATLENLQFVKLYQNAEDVINKLENPDINRVAVVGGGYIGVELAESFKRKGKEVVLVDIAETVMGAYYDLDFTEMMNQNLEKNGIELALGQAVQAIEGDQKVERIVTDKASYDVDMVIMCVGFRPNTALGNGQLETFENGAWIVDKKQETSMKDVYAIGDCATIYDNARDGVSYIALASNAVRTGIVAAHNLCGHDLEGVGVQGSNGISIFGLKMVSTGLTEERAKAAGFNAAVASFMDKQKPEFIKEDNHDVAIKIVYDKDSRLVLGCQMVSYEDMSMGIHMFSLAIMKKVTIEELSLMDIFFLPHFNKPYNYITMAALGAE